ncbi:MAG TPA: MotA/TolQ/ExbB proton channel family protein [Chthoniobacterales bacterium]
MLHFLRFPFRRSLLAAVIFGAGLSAGLAQAPTPDAAPPASAPAATPAEHLTAAAERSHRAQQEVGHRFSSGWGQRLKEGGTTALVQIGLSVFGAMFFFERIFNLSRKKLVPNGLSRKARKLWKEGDFAALEALGKTDPSTLGRAIAWVAQHRHNSYADVSVGAGDILSQEIEVHHQRAYPLGVVATLEPLLGLLGMILGMIQTFEVVALAGALGNPAQLAGGISEALITTGLGLAVAIPFLAFFHYFKSRTNMFSSQLEKEMTGLLSEWFLSKQPEAVYES